MIRLYHTYGPGIPFDDGRVFADFAKNIINKENIILKSAGNVIRSFCYNIKVVTENRENTQGYIETRLRGTCPDISKVKALGFAPRFTISRRLSKSY